MPSKIRQLCQQARLFRKKLQKALDKAVVFRYDIECTVEIDGADVGEHSSAGRAFALQAKGHRFEPCCSHQKWPGSSVG